MKVRWVLFSALAAVLAVAAMAYAGTDTAPQAEAQGQAGSVASTASAAEGDAPVAQAGGVAGPAGPHGPAFAQGGPGGNACAVACSPESLEAARERIDNLLSELQDSGDLSAAGAERLKSELGALEQELFTPPQAFGFGPGFAPGLTMPGLAPPGMAGVVAGPGMHGLFQSAPGSHSSMTMLQDDGKSLNIEIDENGEVSVSGEGYSVEELAEIERNIETSGAWPHGGLFMPTLPHVMSLEQLKELEGQAPHPFTEEQLRELEMYGQQQGAPQYTEEQLRELEQYGQQAGVWAEQLEQQLYERGLNGIAPQGEWQPGEQPFMFAPAPGEVPHWLAPETFEFKWRDGNPAFDLNEGWQSEVDSLMGEIGALLKEFMQSHEAQPETTEDSVFDS